VDAAREAVLNNQSSSSTGRRFWELSGGLFRCGECGCTMMTHSAAAPRMKGWRFYYRCSKRFRHGSEACAHNRCLRADTVEPVVWEVVSGILKDPEQLRADLDAMIEQERNGHRGDPEKETKLWAEKLAELDRQRARAQEGYLAGAFEINELRAKLAELDDARKTAERELEALRGHDEYLDGLEKDRNALLDSLVDVAPDALDSLTPEERHQAYRMLRLIVSANPDSSLEVTGAFGEALCTSESGPSPSSSATRAPSRRGRRRSSP
jgi:site-specific DNA recombinase